MEQRLLNWKLRWYRVLIPYVVESLAWIIVRPMLTFFIHMRVYGSANVRAAEKMAKHYNVGLIFAMNHTSELDVMFALPSVYPFSYSFPMFYVSRPNKAYQAGVVGWRRLIYGNWFLGLFGGHSLNMGSGNYAITLQKSVEILKKGHSVCIFPEGRISEDGKIAKIHGGLGFLAEETRAVIVPITVTGVWDITMREFFTRKRHVTLKYHEPVHASHFDTKEANPNIYKFISEAVTNHIKHGPQK